MVILNNFDYFQNQVDKINVLTHTRFLILKILSLYIFNMEYDLEQLEKKIIVT